MKRRSFSKILCTFLAGTLTLSVGMIGVGAAQIDDSFVSAETASPATGDGLPRAYSSRDLGFVTSVKSQYGQSCWAYASMATLESMLLRLGYDVADMSTDHLNLWATTRSDGTGWQRDIGSDGYPNIALGYLSSWQGGVLQSDAGDVSLNGSYTGDTIPLDLARYGVTSVEYLTKNRPDRIKQCIMDYGGVYSSFGINYAYYSGDRLSYYLPENYTGGYSGHSIEVVGWDDDYPRENFPQMPENNGAWLIKNSHGNYNSLGGYLWISYEDVYLFGSKFKPSYAITGAVPLDGGQKLIQNEIYGATYEFQYPEAPVLTYLNRFTFDEAFNAIDKVIFKSDAVGASYSIYFVPDGADSTPDADQSHWTRLYDGTVSYAGYLQLDRRMRMAAKQRGLCVPQQQQARRQLFDTERQNAGSDGLVQGTRGRRAGRHLRHQGGHRQAHQADTARRRESGRHGRHQRRHADTAASGGIPHADGHRSRQCRL